jgi:transcription elongation GreA/GreB family factor
MDDTSIKHSLLHACRHYVEQRLATAIEAMNDAQRSANEEGKSSAGDKYETGRAMMQMERDKAAIQVEEALKLKRVLAQINPDVHPDKISLGSVVTTKTFKVYIAVGVGSVNVEGEDFLIIAPLSPLGKVLMGLKTNEQFKFNNQQNSIVKIM